MTALWTAQEAAKAASGKASTDWKATGVSIDSRTVTEGDLFIALQGPSFDGHDYVGNALEAGAVAAMVHRVPDGIDPSRLLVVEDTMEGLTALAAAARARTKAKIIAVTGSVGKTGVKEMLKLTLSAQGPTHATAGNLNNQWGLPLSLARMPEDTAFGILEMGMNHAGEIAPLSRLARPHVAVITAIEAVHTEFFASTEEIADAKAEIFEGLIQDGTAVINRDTPTFDRLKKAAGDHAVVGFGRHIAAQVRLLHVTLEPRESLVYALVGEKAVSYVLGIPGRHWAVNSLAVLAAVKAVGGDVSQAAADLVRMHAPKGRGQRHSGVLDVIDEGYNASPASVTAALAILGRDAGRRIAVLGDMLELGKDAATLHRNLAQQAAANADLVFTAGPMMEQLHEALPEEKRGGHAKDSAALVPLLLAAVRPGDVVMVKGSAGSRMGVVVEALVAFQDDERRPRAVNGD